MAVKYFILFFLFLNLFTSFSLADPPDSKAAGSYDLDTYYSLKSDIPKYESSIAHMRKLISEINTGWNRFWSPETTRRIVARHTKDIAALEERIKWNKAQIKKMDEEFTVKKWQMNFGVLEEIETKLGTVNAVHVCPTTSIQGHQFFENDRSFEEWNKKNGDEDKKIAYYSSKDPYISACLDKKGEGAAKSVDTSSSSLCKKVNWLPDTYYGTPVKYTLKKSQGQIIVSTSIAFNYKGDPKKKAEAFKYVQDALPCVKNFFARHGMKLDLTIADKADKTHANCQHEINLYDEFKRNNSVNWSTHKDQGKEMDNNERCTTYIHELSHTLGLNDAYPDVDCPDRKLIGAVDDIMRTVATDVSNVKFYPYAIQKILGPMCDK